MTKYFEIQETPELKYAPRIKNLFGKFDIRTIQLETYPKIPDRQVFIVESSNKTIFTDIILSPFLMISSTVLEVIKMYKGLCFYREVFLIHTRQWHNVSNQHKFFHRIKRSRENKIKTR